MSTKHKKFKKQTKQKFPFILLVLGGLLVAAAAFLFTRPGDGGTASIAVDQQRIDYGDVKFAVAKSFAIQVTNTGAGTLKFKEEPYIEIVEGC